VQETSLAYIKNAPVVGLAEGNAQFSVGLRATIDIKCRDFAVFRLYGIPTSSLSSGRTETVL
jgi:hypothetical protein